ncbi:MAG: hypothetical protein ACXVR1_09880 [Solirubrobacteraceae bacterium]
MTNDTPSAEPGAKPVWPERLTAMASQSHAWLMRPRVRLCVIGVTLLLVGGLIMATSVWTLPLVVIGALMVAVAWIGHRLEGHFAVEWGEAGTQLAFNATVKAPQPAPEAPALEALALDARSEATARTADVIDGEAHTVEINVGELKALIAAAEAGDAPADPVVQDIRIRRLADDDARTPRPAA